MLKIVRILLAGPVAGSACVGVACCCGVELGVTGVVCCGSVVAALCWLVSGVVFGVDVCELVLGLSVFSTAGLTLEVWVPSPVLAYCASRCFRNKSDPKSSPISTMPAST